MKQWSDFNKFGEVTNRYMPIYGEGETIATQTATAINKLVYKWFNDGDVFDNTHFMEGWANDLSTYANWLANHIEGAEEILNGITDCYNDDDYAELLYELCEVCTDLEDMEVRDTLPADGSIYTEQGNFRFEEYDEEDW